MGGRRGAVAVVVSKNLSFSFLIAIGYRSRDPRGPGLLSSAFPPIKAGVDNRVQGGNKIMRER